ncbi:Copia protein, partial [Mucuna pruriens]
MSNQDKTPIKAWSRQKPLAKHLRIFGSICYIHRHKLEDKIVCNIFLGYNTQSKGYRAYNLQRKKLTISQDVKEEEKVEKNNIPIPVQQPQEEVEEVKEVSRDPSMLSPSPQQESSLESKMKTSKKEVWVKAMKEEIKMIEKNNPWELIDCPHEKRTSL